MANLSVENVLKGAKTPALYAGGFMLGIIAQKAINKMLSSETVTNGLGADTVLSFKNYATPLITTALGVGVGIMSQDDLIKKLSMGVATSGAANCMMQFFWKKNLLSGLSGGMLGEIFGTDEDIDEQDGFGDIDDDDLDGIDDDDLDGIDDDELGDLGDFDELPANRTLNTPISVPPLRETEFEKESVSGFASDGGMII